jgi:ubiquitin-like 1-activating enzyme E1 A
VPTRLLLSTFQAELTIRHLSSHASHFFPPTLAILGGFLAQDVLRTLSKKDTPFTNLLAVDTMGGTGTVARWAMGEAVEA